MKLRALLIALPAALVIVAPLLFGYATQSAAAGQASATPARPGATLSAGTASWNPHVSCSATVTTLSKVLGTQTSAQGGATYAGGGFKPGIPDRRSFSPPCSVSGVPTFIELRNITVGSCRSINKDGDWSCTLTDPNVSASVRDTLKKIHIETGTNFRTAGGWSMPPGGKRIDVQGFVFWDPGHTNAGWHLYSGWEIHNFTAWRPAGSSSPPSGGVTGPAHDFTSDGHADVLARDASGKVLSYAGNGAGRFTAGHTTAGTGMGSLSPIFYGGDWNGDGRNDVLGRNGAGDLLMYPGTVSGLAASPRTIGVAWGSMTALAGGADFTGDRHPDIVARNSAGNLLLYRGNGTGGFGAATTMGVGWQGMTALLSVGDFTGDGRSDVVARGSTGLLYVYPGNGAGGLTSGRRTIGTRWNELTAVIAAGDFSGDGRPDIIGRNSGGYLILYRGNGAGGFGSVSTIGVGWGALSLVH